MNSGDKKVPERVVKTKKKPTSDKNKPKVTGEKDLYDTAFKAFSSRKFEIAESLFRSFLDRFPESDLSDNSLYWLGEISYFRKDFDKAIELFSDLPEKYPNGNKNPDALLKIGYSYINLKDNEKASLYLTKVLKKYPFSPAGSKAEKMLYQLRSGD